ncbi:ImmA/IrrE family metallo-endopeptidase [Bacillus sp. B38]|uniref:ImmA/IrrE family metallo-endopeptidase n=1 Tax=Bacillus sp. B38 TaxID=218305 RepID=UPI003C7BBAEF
MAEIIDLFKLQKGVKRMLGTKTVSEEQAEKVLREYTAEGEAINPVLIAKKLGIRVVNAEFTNSDISGALQINPDNTKIYVKHDDSPVRKRFTIAHELGHYFLHSDNQKDFIDQESLFFRNGEKNKIEIEANDFAANLLMPKDRVLSQWKSLEDVYLLSVYFGVSMTAMKYRLKNLGVSID